MNPWPVLRARYTQVRDLYALRYPEDPAPPFPDEGDPNEAVMVIDEMLARMEGRPPTKIKIGPPLVLKIKDDA